MSELSDQDFAYLRFVQFGELPDRVRPEAFVETVESDPPQRSRPEPALTEEQWRALQA